MAAHPWRALGQRLRRLREDLDLGQKNVSDALGERMGERLLRAYERGEQRPSRDRLLRLSARSFKLTNASDVNALLKLACYAVLSEEEKGSFGFSRIAASTPGPPADFRIEVSTLIVVDGQGREVWRHQFPKRLLPDGYGQQNLFRRCTFHDIDDDGRVETLFVYVPFDFGTEGLTLFCFGEDGSIKWEFVPGRPEIDDTTPRHYVPPYFISNVHIVPFRDSPSQILVSSNHYLHNPNQIAMLDVDGRLISEYWHSGHLPCVAHGDVNNDGVEEILLAGVNNGYRLATLVIFDSRNVRGASSQPGRQILGFPTGGEKAVVLFPRTCLSKDASYNRAVELRVTKQRIMLAVAEGVSEARNPGGMIYELDFDLNVVNARPDSHLQEAHRAAEMDGKLDHAWTEKENERLRSEVVVKKVGWE